MGLLARASLSPRLDDSDMLVAIRCLTKTEITALLVKFPSGQLKLHPSLLGHRSVSRALKVDLFLERGEDINSICGPDGTFLHAAVGHFHGPPVRDRPSDKKYRTNKVKALFDKCIARGADLKATGPHGNALEYTWKQGHVGFCLYHPFLIKRIVELEVPNSICDPNGQIPSRERMLAVSEKEKIDAQDRSLYYHGTTTRSVEWHEVEKESGEYKPERRPEFEPHGLVGAEDAASMQSTIPMPDPSSRGIDRAVSRDIRARSIEEE